MRTREVSLPALFCKYYDLVFCLSGHVIHKGPRKWRLELSNEVAERILRFAESVSTGEKVLLWRLEWGPMPKNHRNSYRKSAELARKALLKFLPTESTMDALQRDLTTLQMEIDETVCVTPRLNPTDLATLTTMRFFSTVIQGYLQGDYKTLARVKENVKKLARKPLTT